MNSVDGVFDPEGDRDEIFEKVADKRMVEIEFFRPAIKYGHLDCLRMVEELGCPLVMNTESKFLEMYDYKDHVIYARKPRFKRCPEFCSMAAYYGQLACLEFFHQHGLPWNVLTCVAAILGGNVECLKYAVENGCAIDKPYPIQAAASLDKLTILKYLYEHGCPWSIKACTYSARKGHLECLKYMRANGCPWDISTCTAAVKSGNFECLKYIVENGCPLDTADPTEEAAYYGNLTFLKYLREHGCPWSRHVCGYAESQKHLSLERAHLERFSGDYTSCEDALKDVSINRYPRCENVNHVHSSSLFHEHSECLVYAWINGCPWDLGTCSVSSGDGRMDCLLSEPDHNCMWDKDKFEGYSAVIRQTRPITTELLEPLLFMCTKQKYTYHIKRLGDTEVTLKVPYYYDT